MERIKSCDISISEDFVADSFLYLPKTSKAPFQTRSIPTVNFTRRVLGTVQSQVLATEDIEEGEIGEERVNLPPTKVPKVFSNELDYTRRRLGSEYMPSTIRYPFALQISSPRVKLNRDLESFDKEDTINLIE